MRATRLRGRAGADRSVIHVSTRTPRPDQARALTDLATAFAAHDRVQLTLPCGTGKTLIGRWHAQAADAKRVLVLLPSLALLAQTLREWRSVPGWSFEAHIICSDPTTAAGSAERNGGSPDLSAEQAQVTTDPNQAARFLQRTPHGRAQVIFSTYHSSPVVAAAASRTQVAFDLVICDEAHRLAGTPSHDFRTVLEPRAIPARHRLFMTATPRSTGPEGYSMDDPRTFGVVAHTASFGDAIRAGLLVDYQVLVVGTTSTAAIDPSRGTLVPTALLDAIDQHQLARLLTFHSRVATAAEFATVLDGATTAAGTRIQARHLSGTTPTNERAKALAWLAETPEPGEARVITNARLLTEGIDVPAVDGICFADPRSSVVDIIQAIGRVVRPSPGKVRGSIIVPVALPDDVDDDTELLVSRFGLLWQVLRALRSHDQRFALEVDMATRGRVHHGHRGYTPTRVQFHLPESVDLDILRVRLVEQLADSWERFHATYQQWASCHPGRRTPRTARQGGLRIGEWAAKQRAAHAAGVLTADRVVRLEQLPQWYWDRADASWEDTYTQLNTLAAARGTAADHPTGPSVYDGMYSTGYPREQLGTWLARQRQGYRDGTLDLRRVRLLEQLPGWSWTPVPREDLAHVDALRQFVEFEGHADVPDRHIEDGLALGSWCWKVRRAKLTGTLPPALEHEIIAAAPSRWARGIRRCWQWDKPETQWRLAFVALRQFAAREGHSAPANGHCEQLSDGSVAIGQWVALQRHTRRHGELSNERQRLLEALPGWLWDGNNGGALAEQPALDLPAHLIHGQAGAAARNCQCGPCQQHRRQTGRDYLARRRAARAEHGVDPAPARRRLVSLEKQLRDALSSDHPGRGTAGRSLIASTSGVPLGVLRQLVAGTLPAISPEHRDRLDHTTVEMCLSNTSQGSRGRITQRDQERIDGTETRALLADLGARGFDLAWVGRELGVARGLQVGAGRLTRHTAERIAQLHQQVGDLRAPHRPRGQALPPLSQLTQRQPAREGPAA